MSADLPGMGGDFAKGMSGPPSVFDTSPAGLGLSPAYLASSSASASSSTTTSGTIFPTSPADGNIFIYTADAANGIKWPFVYDSSQTTYKWVCIGPSPLIAVVDADESCTSTSYTDLATVGPAIIVPFAGDYVVTFGAYLNVDGSAANQSTVSFAVGGTGALDADAILLLSGITGQTRASASRTRAKTGVAAAASIKLKYKVSNVAGRTIGNRWLSVIPLRVTG